MIIYSCLVTHFLLNIRIFCSSSVFVYGVNAGPLVEGVYSWRQEFGSWGSLGGRPLGGPLGLFRQCYAIFKDICRVILVIWVKKYFKIIENSISDNIYLFLVEVRQIRKMSKKYGYYTKNMLLDKNKLLYKKYVFFEKVAAKNSKVLKLEKVRDFFRKVS